MVEKNIDAEIKKKHEEFDRELENYLNQFRAKESPNAGLSPAIQSLKEKAIGLRSKTTPARR